jgi:hypothetical protein
VRKGKYLSESFHTQNNVKQRNALSPPLFMFALEYAVMNAQQNQVELKLDGGNVNLLGDNINTINKTQKH